MVKGRLGFHRALCCWWTQFWGWHCYKLFAWKYNNQGKLSCLKRVLKFTALKEVVHHKRLIKNISLISVNSATLATLNHTILTKHVKKCMPLTNIQFTLVYLLHLLIIIRLKTELRRKMSRKLMSTK